MNDWETEIGRLVRSTYAKAGYQDVTIIIGSTKGEDVHTQVWYPEKTASEFDLRLVLFHMFAAPLREFGDSLETDREEGVNFDT